MGYWYPDPTLNDGPRYDDRWIAEHIMKEKVTVVGPWCAPRLNASENGDGQPVPYYNSSLNAAWCVVQKMLNHDLYEEFMSRILNNWELFRTEPQKAARLICETAKEIVEKNPFPEK